MQRLGGERIRRIWIAGCPGRRAGAGGVRRFAISAPADLELGRAQAAQRIALGVAHLSEGGVQLIRGARGGGAPVRTQRSRCQRRLAEVARVDVGVRKGQALAGRGADRRWRARCWPVTSVCECRRPSRGSGREPLVGAGAAGGAVAPGSAARGW